MPISASIVCIIIAWLTGFSAGYYPQVGLNIAIRKLSLRDRSAAQFKRLLEYGIAYERALNEALAGVSRSQSPEVTLTVKVGPLTKRTSSAVIRPSAQNVSPE